MELFENFFALPENVDESLSTGSSLSAFPSNPTSISPSAPEITWAGGIRTKVPWIDGDSASPNILERVRPKIITLLLRLIYLQDEVYVRTLARDALPASECPFIKIINWKDHRDDEHFANYVCSLHSRGIFVVVRNFSEDKVSLSANDLLTKLKVSLNSMAEVHCKLDNGIKTRR